MSTVEKDPATVPGAMEHTLRRETPLGLIEFEFAPVGWLAKNGQPRRRPWRRYYFTAKADEGLASDRVSYPSTTTVLDTICPKDGLPPWAEARGIEGAVQAVEQGLIEPGSVWAKPEHAIHIVRDNELGAEAAKNRAAERGLNVHDLLREYMETGNAPLLSAHAEEHRGYIQALSSWLIQRDPEPLAVEQLVASPADGYAGRLDLRARVKDPTSITGDRVLTTIDAKTSEHAGIYRGAHLQVGLYERAAQVCGGEPAERLAVVVFAADGRWREMTVDIDINLVVSALDFYRRVRPIDSRCNAENRREKAERA